MGKGDRVAIIMRNLPEWPVAFFGATALGAIVTPLNAWWTGPELEYGLTDSGAKVADLRRASAGAHREHLAALPGAGAGLRQPPAATPAGATGSRTSIGAPAELGRACPTPTCRTSPLDPDDDATILYTSGTTGKPKGALGTHRNMHLQHPVDGYALGAGGASCARRGRRPIRTPQGRPCCRCRSSTPPAASRS